MPWRLWGERHVDQLTFASVASNGANARLMQVGPFQRDARIKGITFIPTGADQSFHSASYRRLSLYNAGTAGTATATANRLASLNITASQASLGTVPFSLVYPATGTAGSSGTFASGETLYFSQETVGGTETNGTVLRAGQLSMVIEFIG